jgi:hypothetical protein
MTIEQLTNALITKYYKGKPTEARLPFWGVVSVTQVQPSLRPLAKLGTGVGNCFASCCTKKHACTCPGVCCLVLLKYIACSIKKSQIPSNSKVKKLWGPLKPVVQEVSCTSITTIPFAAPSSVCIAGWCFLPISACCGCKGCPYLP